MWNKEFCSRGPRGTMHRPDSRLAPQTGSDREIGPFDRDG
jgi:hypothetical protein